MGVKKGVTRGPARRAADAARRRPAEALFEKKQKANPYRGPRADGWDAFQRGSPLTANPYCVPGDRRGERWLSGWKRAKLAQEQGKSSV